MAATNWLLLICLVYYGTSSTEWQVTAMSPIMKRCFRPVDLILLLDSSGSLGIDNWRKELDFAAQFLDSFEISPDKSHVGIIDFSMVAKNHLELNDPNQSIGNIQTILTGLKDESKYQNGMTMTDFGLIAAIEMFDRAKQNTARLVPQILVVVTDGQTTWRDGKKGLDLIQPHVAKLTDLKVTIFAIAIGPSINDQELNALARVPARVFKHDNFGSLIYDVQNIAEMTCPDKPKEPEETDCSVHFRKVGCFKDNQVDPRPLENYALNARDSSHKNFIGIKVDWNNYEKFLKDFICRCAKKSTEMQHKHFGIQFYGECWTGASETYMKDGESEPTGCINGSFRPCNTTDQHCTGVSHRNQVYILDEESLTQG